MKHNETVTTDSHTSITSNIAEPNSDTKPLIESIGNQDNSASTVNKTATIQMTNNLHPYRTSTQHYPSLVNRSTANATDNTNQPINRSEQDHTVAHSASNLSANEQKQTISTSDDQIPLEGLEAYLQEQEKRLIITALKQTDWNKTQAAELLGTTFRSLRYRMTKLDIAEDQSGE